MLTVLLKNHFNVRIRHGKVKEKLKEKIHVPFSQLLISTKVSIIIIEQEVYFKNI
jgi:hypothetical protein